MPNTAYGDISPITAAHAAKEFLDRAVPMLVLEKFGQSKTLPANDTKTMTFRRYNALSAAPNALTEGVTPSAKQLTKTDVTTTLVQYGDLVTITDVVQDTHTDPILKESVEILGEQAGNMIETVRFNVIKAGTNVGYANGVAGRANVASKIAIADQRRATRALKRQNARKLTSVIRSTAAYDTANIPASFIAVCHSDLESDIRDLPGFVPTEKYGTLTPFESEIGKVEDVRYVTSTVFEAFLGAGVAVASAPTLLSAGGTAIDVYPILYLGRDAYGIVALKGKTAITPMVVSPKPSDSDPLAQRGHVSWKTMQNAIILNDLWMYRLEVGVSK